MHIREADDGSLTLDASYLGSTAAEAFRRAGSLARGRRLVIEGIDTPDAHARALACAAALHTSVVITTDENDVVMATLTTPSDLNEPRVREDAPRPGRMAPDFPVADPNAPANDYRARIAHARDHPMPTEPITVVITAHDPPSVFETTLWAIAHQTYPGSLIDLVIVDSAPGTIFEGAISDSLVSPFADGFRSIRDLRHRGDASEVVDGRTVGIEAAETDWVILLDGGGAPVPRLVELFARHLGTESHAVYCGHRRYVDPTGIEPADVRQSMSVLLGLPDVRDTSGRAANREHDVVVVDERVRLYEKTHSLRFEHHPFRAVEGGSIGFTKQLFETIGPFDERLGTSGAELVEWGYRAWNRGNYIIPILDACELYMGKPRSPADETGREVRRRVVDEYCPVRPRQGRRHTTDSVPLVSIYVPVYNAVGTVESAIQSALSQTIVDLEVCVVDDGSIDGTAELIGATFGSDPRVRVERQANEGIGAASNRAVRMCRAPFIGQLDADDRLKPNAVERLLDVLRSDDRIGVAYSSSELIDASGERVGDSFEFPYYSRYELMYLMIIHHFRLFRARDWYRTDGFATDIANAVDYDMFLKLAEVTDMVHVPEQLYQYQKHSASTSQASHGIQRANHRLAVQRALGRRGLSAEWQMLPHQPVDVREYEFVRRELPPTHFGSGLDLVRLSIDVGWSQRDDIALALEAMFPAWQMEMRQRLGAPRVETPPLSHARAIRAIPLISSDFPHAAIRLVYA